MQNLVSRILLLFLFLCSAVAGAMCVRSDKPFFAIGHAFVALLLFCTAAEVLYRIRVENESRESAADKWIRSVAVAGLMVATFGAIFIFRGLGHELQGISYSLLVMTGFMFIVFGLSIVGLMAAVTFVQWTEKKATDGLELSRASNTNSTEGNGLQKVGQPKLRNHQGCEEVRRSPILMPWYYRN